MNSNDKETNQIHLSVPSARKDANQNVTRIMAAAKSVFKEKGAEAKVEEIAAKAEIGVGTVYRRFINKERLIWAVGMDVIKEIREKQLLDVNLPVPADQKICLILEEFLLLHRKYGKLHEMLLQLSEETEFGEEIKQTLTDVIQVAIKEGQEQGIFRKQDPVVLEAYILHLVNPKLISTLRYHIPVEEIPKTISKFVLKGLS
ncbi:TetR/AcrR family transcriptional regulator [Gracilibacillus suaedae]|uniref:TetR/AcrR family transcriptional regulator n=1 Tax=Gracilibacillus suaedae TaxID=2820273 RepID=UPI001ABDB55E|nr:TetR/AcrR family transcriptional regulator [Gracilibacillus suaedae]